MLLDWLGGALVIWGVLFIAHGEDARGWSGVGLVVLGGLALGAGLEILYVGRRSA